MNANPCKPADTSFTTPRAAFMAALDRKPIRGRVPHFELIFYPTMECFGKIHPDQRDYSHWDQMEVKERQLHRQDLAQLYIDIAERFEHSAIFLRPNPRTIDETIRLVDVIRGISGNKFFVMKGGDATFGIPDGQSLADFCCRLVDEPLKVKEEATRMVETAVRRAEIIWEHGGLDGFCLNVDYCFNQGPFLSPSQFEEFVAPYLAQLIKAYRDMEFYTIKHTDGNVMPILDQLVQARPHAIHSLDPMAGVDIADVKQRFGKQICLIGNVNCGVLNTGPADAIRESARYALRNGMPGNGYVFSSSNCINTGMPLANYEIMLDVWRQEGNY